MEQFIGLPLDDVLSHFEKLGKKVVVQTNSFKLQGDTVLVTNVKEQNDCVILVVGDFIFNLKKEQNDNI